MATHFLVDPSPALPSARQEVTSIQVERSNTLKIASAILQNPEIPLDTLDWTKLITPLEFIEEKGLKPDLLVALFAQAAAHLKKGVEPWKNPNYRDMDNEYRAPLLKEEEMQLKGEEIKALTFYTTEIPSGYNFINFAVKSDKARMLSLMNASGISEDKYQEVRNLAIKLALLCGSCLNKLPSLQTCRLYRGAVLSAKDYSAIIVNALLVTNKFWSCSLKRDSASDFMYRRFQENPDSKAVIFIISHPSGAKNVNYAGLSAHPAEKEGVYPPFFAFRVTEVKEKKTKFTLPIEKHEYQTLKESGEKVVKKTRGGDNIEYGKFGVFRCYKIYLIEEK